jgi:hypothetical protein
MSQEHQNQKKNSGAELALHVFAEHLISALFKDLEVAEDRLLELRSKAEHGETSSLPSDEYETYRYWEGKKTGTEEAMDEIYSFMRRLGYDQY